MHGVVRVNPPRVQTQEDREILYLAIDQHRKQLTVNVRNEMGDVILKRQVSTEWTRVRDFLAEVQKLALSRRRVCRDPGGLWLQRLVTEAAGRVYEYSCHETILIQSEKRSKKKTDRSDANTLGEILLGNRQRLLAGKTIEGIRRVQLPGKQDAQDRQITAFRQRLGRLRTQTINRIKHLLGKHNLEQECPSKGLDTIKGKKWLSDSQGSIIERATLIGLTAYVWRGLRQA